MRAVLVLDEHVKGDVQHGERRGPEHGLEQAVRGRRRRRGAGQLALALGGALQEATLVGEGEQRLADGGGVARGAAQRHVVGGGAPPGHGDVMAMDWRVGAAA